MGKSKRQFCPNRSPKSCKRSVVLTKIGIEFYAQLLIYLDGNNLEVEKQKNFIKNDSSILVQKIQFLKYKYKYFMINLN